jgi:hypothetical protein
VGPSPRAKYFEFSQREAAKQQAVKLCIADPLVKAKRIL